MYETVLIMGMMPNEFSATHPLESPPETASTAIDKPRQDSFLPHETPQKQRELVKPGAQDMQSGG